MHIRKTAAVILALIVVMSLAVPTFAATGYGPGTINPGTISGGGSSGGSSGGGGGGGSGSGSSFAPSTSSSVATASSVGQAVSNALNAAASGVSSASVRNVGTLAASAIKDAFAKAKAAGKDLTLNFDVVEGGTVQSRIYIDAATADALTGDIDFSVSVKAEDVASTKNTFEKFFSNNVAVVKLGQKGAYGANIKMAVKVDLSMLNTSDLVLYTYDKATGQYAKLTAGYNIDSNGYLHFSTPTGGDIIISDKPLARK